MTERPRSTIDLLLTPTPAQMQQEAALPSGYIPERWLQIEAVELQRMRAGMSQTLQERVAAYPEGEVQRRADTVRRYLGDLTLPPSFPNGPYAASRWLNFYEMLPRVVNVKQEEAIVPDVDSRVPFSSTGLSKDMVLSGWVIDRVQAALPEEERLRREQINDCFTNVSQEQFEAVVDQIAQSGLALMPESPTEHWQRIVRESSPKE